MTDGIPQFSTTNTDYGDVLHATILKIFGDELTYNELEPYTRDKDDYSHLEVKEERNNHEGFMFVSVFIDKHKIMEKKYDVNWSYDMFHYLSELELEEDDSEDDSEDDEEEEEEEEEEEDTNWDDIAGALWVGVMSEEKREGNLALWLDKQEKDYNPDISKSKGMLRNPEIHKLFTEFMNDPKFSKHLTSVEKKNIYKMSWYESKRHRKSHTDMYYEKEEHTRWAYFNKLCRVTVISVIEDSNEYKSAINNSFEFMKSMRESREKKI